MRLRAPSPADSHRPGRRCAAPTDDAGFVPAAGVKGPTLPQQFLPGTGRRFYPTNRQLNVSPAWNGTNPATRPGTSVGTRSKVTVPSLSGNP